MFKTVSTIPQRDLGPEYYSCIQLINETLFRLTFPLKPEDLQTLDKLLNDGYLPIDGEEFRVMHMVVDELNRILDSQYEDISHMIELFKLFQTETTTFHLNPFILTLETKTMTIGPGSSELHDEQEQGSEQLSQTDPLDQMLGLCIKEVNEALYRLTYPLQSSFLEALKAYVAGGYLGQGEDAKILRIIVDELDRIATSDYKGVNHLIKLFKLFQSQTTTFQLNSFISKLEAKSVFVRPRVLQG